MPPKIRLLEKELRKAGFTCLHPKGARVTISGKAGANAHPYQVSDVQEVLALVKNERK